MGMPASSTQKTLAMSDGAPPPYSMVLPNGASVSDAILNAWRPRGIPTMVMQNRHPTPNQ